MPVRSPSLFVSLALCLSAVAAFAQEQAPENPREAVRRQFLASGLDVGSPFPDVPIHDAEGKPFRTGDLRGSYCVLVTGCLT